MHKLMWNNFRNYSSLEHLNFDEFQTVELCGILAADCPIRDVIEGVVFKKAVELGLYLYSPQKELVRIEANIIGQPNRTADELFENKLSRTKILKWLFDPTILNRDDNVGETSDFKEEYLAEILFAHAPMYHCRNSYTVNLEAYDLAGIRAAEEKLVFWEWKNLGHPDLLRSFSGWSLVVKAMHEKELTFPKLLAPIQSYIDNLYFESEEKTSHDKTVGRPRYDAAFNEFKKMSFDRGDLSWKALVNSIEEKTGERPDPATFRSWAKENKID